MQSPKVKEVEDYLREHHVTYVSSVRTNPNSDTILLFVHETLVAHVASSGKTSKRQLSYLRKRIERDLDIQTECLISKGPEQVELESGLSALLKRHYPKSVQDCFVSWVETVLADVWVELLPKGPAQVMELTQGIKSVVSKYLHLFDLKLRYLHLGVDGEDVPTSVALLKAVKLAEPATIQELEGVLRSWHLMPPTDSWLKSKIDALRKHALVLRRADGRYVVTYAGLSLIPHSKSRVSSDIQRVLALARKKW